MAADSSSILGATELAGCFVSPKGLTKQITGATAGGMTAGLAGRVMADRVLDGSGAGPAFGRLGYVAVTAAEVAVVKGKAGLLKPKLSPDVVDRVSRSRVAAVDLDTRALTAVLTIRFDGGGAWQFEVPKVHRRDAQQVVRVLRAPDEHSGKT